MMICSVLETIDEAKVLNGLLSKGNFDNVGGVNAKPSAETEGLADKISDLAKSDNGSVNSSILPEPPNLYKQYGTSVNNSGYFIIPRSVTSDPRYKCAKLKYKHVLHVIFESVAFAKTSHAIGTHVINIEIGQFCVSIRGLMDLCNNGVIYKEDKVDKNVIERASRYWQTCGLVRQEVRHGKILLTITVPEFYRKEKPITETGTETKPRHDRDTKEEDKEDKEDNISKEKGSFVPSSFATSLLSEFYSSLFLAIPDFPKESAKKTKSQYLAADSIGNKCNNDMDLIRKVLAYAHTKDGFWLSIIHSVVTFNKKFNMLVQQMRTQGKRPMNGQKPESHHNKSFNKDTRPVQYNNKMSFKDHV